MNKDIMKLGAIALAFIFIAVAYACVFSSDITLSLCDKSEYIGIVDDFEASGGSCTIEFTDGNKEVFSGQVCYDLKIGGIVEDRCGVVLLVEVIK